MAKTYVIFNPFSNNKKGGLIDSSLESFKDKEVKTFDISKEGFDYKKCISELKEEDELYICGGDGTLNIFINETKGHKYDFKIYYYATGTGNDFLRDIKGVTKSEPVLINEYLENLPTVVVNNKEYLFLNGVGYGIDGYCCEVGDRLREQEKSKINYTLIAIKGLLFHYKPVDAIVTVDGVEHKFKKVWLAPTMYGKYYGGGMIPTPNQTRKDAKISILIFHGSGKLKTLMIFPSIFKGEHVKKEKNVTVLSGNTIEVRYSSPRSLQIDGETILNISSYKAYK